MALQWNAALTTEYELLFQEAIAELFHKYYYYLEILISSCKKSIQPGTSVSLPSSKKRDC